MVKLYEYQLKYLSDLPTRAIMAADTGTGKTFMALAHYEKHAFGQPLLILAPASKVRTKDWERELDEYFKDESGNFRVTMPEVVIYSYEKFSRNVTMTQFKAGKRNIWHTAVPRLGGKQYAVICDEVHRCKNPQSGIGKAVYEATKGAKFFVGLSATPLPNGWIDFAGYSKIFGFTKNITEFKKKYVQFATYVDFPKIEGYYREGELTKQWQSISKKLSKAEALDLPTRTFVGVNFKRPAEYTKLIVTRVLDDGTMLDTASSLAHAVRQTLTAPKMEYLSDLVEGTTENMVIFYNYISERETILDMLKKKHPGKTVFRQDGEKHQLPAKEDWHKVNNSVTVAQFRSGSTGVEMTYATVVVYFSPTYSYADYVQSIGRVYRNGQKEKTTFFNFRTPGTIEASVYEVLKNKGEFQVKQWFEKEVQ